MIAVDTEETTNANALKTYNDFVPRIGSWNG